MQISTDRLAIRPLREDDFPIMRKLALDFERSPYAIYDMPFPTGEAACRALTKQFADTGLFFAVCLACSSEMIGYVCFHKDGDAYDLGYRFHSAHHGKGYAFEACTALMAHLQRIDSVRAFTAGTALDNAPSCRLLAKLGFVLHSTERISFHKDASGNDLVFEGGNFIKPLS